MSKTTKPAAVAVALAGGILLAGLTAFVQTMAISRSENFRYANPFCAGCAAVVTAWCEYSAAAGRAMLPSACTWSTKVWV